MWRFIGFLLALSLTGAAGVSDIRKRVIPNRLIVGFGMAAVVFVFVQLIVLKNTGELFAHLLAALLTGGGLLLVCVISRGGLGMGDVKLFAVMGLLLGADILMTLFCSFAAAAFFSIAGILIRRMKRDARLALAPFAFVGTAAALIIAIC